MEFDCPEINFPRFGEPAFDVPDNELDDHTPKPDEVIPFDTIVAKYIAKHERQMKRQQRKEKEAKQEPSELLSKKKKKKKKKKKTKRGKNVLKTTEMEEEGEEVLHSKAGTVKAGRVEKKKEVTREDQMPTTAEFIESISRPIAGSVKMGKGYNVSFVVPFRRYNDLEYKLQSSLKGGRFRYINEALYLQTSAGAEQVFKEDEDSFELYHAGYQQQVKSWPINPLHRIIKMIKRLPIALEIGDFGCGEGELAQSVPHRVFSMDLVSSRDDIIACNIVNTPLQAQSLDVAVYCLSLMGINLKDYLLEANRVLRPGGFVYIAEIRSRFTKVQDFINFMNACGFKLIRKQEDVDVFFFFQFKKERNVGRVAIVPDFSLKPCIYKKR